MLFDRRGLWLAHALMLLAIVCAATFAVGNNDTFGHLALGRQIVTLGYVPKLDTFSFWQPTAQPFVNYEWLSDVILWITYSLGSYDALIALKLLVLAITGALLVQLAFERRGLPAAWLTVLLWVLSLSSVRFRLTERPQIFGLMLAAFLLLALRRVASSSEQPDARRRVTLWTSAIAVSHLAWVNLHGSNLLGLVLTGLHLLTFWHEPLARLRVARVLALQLLASCVSPYGPFILLDAIAHVANPEYRQLVSEWAPWNASNPVLWAAALATQTLLVALCIRPLLAADTLAKTNLFCLLLLGAMAVRSLRFIDMYLLLGAPLVAEGLALRLQGVAARRVALGVQISLPLAAALAIHSAALMPPFQPLGLGFWPVTVPAVSGDWLRAHRPRARILTAMSDAFYLMFAVPEATFFHDGRVPFYGPAHTRLASAALGSPKIFRSLVDRYRIDTVIVHHSLAAERALLVELLHSSDFALVCIEDRNAVFARRDRAAGADAITDSEVFRTLRPGYEAGPLLDPAASLTQISTELARVPIADNTRAYRSWTTALLSLRPLARAAERAGFRPAQTSAEQALFVHAFAALRVAADRVADVPLLYAYAAAAAIGACKLQDAQSYLALAEKDGGSRETLLLQQELAVRQGQRSQVEHFIEQAQALSRDDPWLAGLRDELRAGVSCPKP